MEPGNGRDTIMLEPLKMHPVYKKEPIWGGKN